MKSSFFLKSGQSCLNNLKHDLNGRDPGCLLHKNYTDRLHLEPCPTIVEVVGSKPFSQIFLYNNEEHPKSGPIRRYISPFDAKL